MASGGRTGLDSASLASLGGDAIPALVASYGSLSDADNKLVGQALARRWAVLRAYPSDSDLAG